MNDENSGRGSRDGVFKNHIVRFEVEVSRDDYAIELGEVLVL
jgi:hypothetical protein